MKVAVARKVAFQVLLSIEKQKAYAHIALAKALRESTSSPEDAALTTEIVQGVLLWQRLLDHWLENLAKRPIAKIDKIVRLILLIGIYQLRFLSRVPSYAILHDAVEMTKEQAPHASGFVNAILRQATREPTYLKPLLRLEENEGLPLSEIALRLSFPDWLVETLQRSFNEKDTIAILFGLNQKGKRTIRRNRLKITRDALHQEFEELGYEVEPAQICEDALYVSTKSPLLALPSFREGKFTVQGESSMLIAPLLLAKPAMRILDACAAPGGKATHLAELTNDQAHIDAIEVHASRASLITQQVKRLSLTSVSVIVADVLSVHEHYDRILLDAPCSGLGSIGRKPDVKWSMTPQKIKQLHVVQRQLLDHTASLLNPDGILLYTTCTLNRTENEDQVHDFLAMHSEFEPFSFTEQESQSLHGIVEHPYMGYIYPQDFGGDGFFVARLRRHS
nr:16S rRNA (cytosine(967)-C(5))-methyltransferase RsmB [Bacilli bacterium]